MTIIANNINDDELDLRELFMTLYRGKIIIMAFIVIAFALGAIYLNNTERKYTVTYLLKSVGSKQKENSFSKYNNLATLAGIGIPTSSDNDLMLFKELITSNEVAEIVLKKKNLLKAVFAGEWDEALGDFSEQEKSANVKKIISAKMFLTGTKPAPYIAPNANRLASYFKNNVNLSINKETGFLVLSSEVSNPELILKLMLNFVKATDDIKRQRYIDFSEEPLEYYKNKLRTARSREHREALASLISAEEQKLMFASKGTYFVAEPFIKPVIGTHPSSPNSKLTLALSLVLGMFIGCAFVLIKNLFRNE